MNSVILVLTAVVAQSSESTPAWLYMPTSPREAWREREKARKTWIRQQKVIRAMQLTNARRERIELKKNSGWYDRFRIYNLWYYHNYRRY